MAASGHAHETVSVPKLSQTTLPAAVYRDNPVQWELERRTVFSRTWQLFGHESELLGAGRWLSETLAGFPLLVVRDEQGGLRGFHNVCRHRAGPLTNSAAGVCEGLLTCQYHGWTYALDGRLRSARDFGPAADFDPRDYGLFPVRVETWRGLVFVAIDDEIAPLNQLVAPLERRLSGRDWSGFGVAQKRSHPIACNWKTYVENYLEGYHVPLIHAALDAEIDSSNYQVTMEGKVALHEAPQRSANPVYEGLWAWLWPNLGVNVYGSGVMMERISPLGSAACRLDYLYLTPKGEMVAEETLEMSDRVTAEDVAISEAVQINLNAGVYDVGRLSVRHETAVAAFQGFLLAATEDPEPSGQTEAASNLA